MDQVTPKEAARLARRMMRLDKERRRWQMAAPERMKNALRLLRKFVR